MDDLIERLQLIAELSGNLTSSEAASIAARAIERIAALEAENAQVKRHIENNTKMWNADHAIAQKLIANNALLIGLVKEAGEMLVMFLRHKTSTGDDCFTFRLTTEHIRWAEAALAKIKENLNA